MPAPVVPALVVPERVVPARVVPALVDPALLAPMRPHCYDSRTRLEGDKDVVTDALQVQVVDGVKDGHLQAAVAL